MEGKSRSLEPTSGRRLVSHRALVLISLALTGLWAAVELRLDPRDLLPGTGGWTMAKELVSHAVAPAWSYQADDLPADILPLPLKAVQAAKTTVLLAVAATSLSVVVGLCLAFAASSVTWAGDPEAGGTSRHRTSNRHTSSWRRMLKAMIYGTVRLIIALMRSVHELLWAVLLLAAFGLGQLSAIIAIAIPYSGILAKVFSEILDETPRDAAHALRASGASPSQAFLFGLLPRALPDMISYALYRFECALRSSAVLGFFGFPTLGYYLAASFENLYYGEVWTYLYTLFALVVLTDVVSKLWRCQLAA